MSDEAEYLVNRFEVIDHTKNGNCRCYGKFEQTDFEVAFSHQDDGRTLKVFLQEPPSKETNDEQ